MKFRPAPRRLVAATAAVLVTAGMAGCSADASSGEQTTIRYQSVRRPRRPRQLADALGYLDGLDAEARRRRHGRARGAAGAGHRPDRLSAVALLRRHRPARRHRRADQGRGAVRTARTTTSNSQLLVLDRTPDQAAREDLIGKKVAVNTLGANSEAVLDTWLDAGGADRRRDRPGHPRAAAAAQHRGGAARGPGRRRRAVLRQTQGDALEHGGLRTLVNDTDVVGPLQRRRLRHARRLHRGEPRRPPRSSSPASPRPSSTSRRTPSRRSARSTTRCLEEHGLRRLRQAVDANLARHRRARRRAACIADEDIAHLARLARRPRATSTPATIDVRRIYTNELQPLREGATDR